MTHNKEDDIVSEIEHTVNDVYRIRMSRFNKNVHPILRCIIGVAMICLGITSFLLAEWLKGAFTLMFGIFIICIPIVIKRNAMKFYESNKMFRNKHQYRFNKEGIESIAENNYIWMKWTDLHDFKETKDDFHYYLSINQALVIPKKYFSEEQITRIVHYSDKIPKKKKSSRFWGIGCLYYFLLFFIILVLLIRICM